MEKIPSGCCRDNGKRLPKVVKLYAEEGKPLLLLQDEILKKRAAEITFLNEAQIFARNLLVFVNPVGGKGEAVQKWRIAEDIFAKCGFRMTVIQTSYAQHAKNYVEKLPLEELLEYNGILTVSGDGLPHEVVNAILARPDADQAKTVPLGILPGGSGNALFTVICEQAKEKDYFENAAYMIARGETVDLDITRMETESGKIIHSFLTLTWGFICDVDLGSEFLRFLGGLRFDVYAVWRILAMRQYLGKFFFSSHVTGPHELPSLSTEINPDGKWNKFDGPFISVVVNNLPLISKGVVATRESEMDDGHNFAQILRGGENAGRYHLTRLALALDSGDHIQNGRGHEAMNLDYSKLKAFRLVPEGENPRWFSIDGERYEPEKIQGVVLPKHMKVYGTAKRVE